MRNVIYILREKGLELVLGALIGLAVGSLPASLGKSPYALTVVALALVLVYLWLRDQRNKSRNLSLGDIVAFKRSREGVIFTVGLRSAEKSSVVYLVFEALKPKFIGFLGTPETRGVIDQIVKELNLEEGKHKVECWGITEFEEGKIKTLLVIDWMRRQGLKDRDIVLDVTGGTATMSIAAFIAAQEKRIDCQYIQSRYDQLKNEHIKETQKPILITNYSEVNGAESEA